MSDEIKKLDADADMVKLTYRNKPDPRIIGGPGLGPRFIYEINWEKRKRPFPKDFRQVSDIETDLLTLFVGNYPDELTEKRDELYQQLTELRDLMMDYRGLDDADRRNLMMGDLEVLPEVEEKRTEKVQYGEWPDE